MTGVVVVEDDHLIAGGLSRALERVGFSVEVAFTLGEGRAAVGAGTGLVLCDLSLPDGNGLDLVRELAVARPTLPVIILTADDEEAAIIAGLKGGAVDYITKPFRAAELMARIDTHLRHRHVLPPPSTTMPVGDLVIHVDSRRVFRGGQEIELRPKEFDLLHRLARSVNAVVHRAHLIADVWGQNWVGSTKTLDVHINAIRRKLGEAPGGRSRISSVRGVGYRLELD